MSEIKLRVTLEMDGDEARALYRLIGNLTGKTITEALAEEKDGPLHWGVDRIFKALSGTILDD